MQKLNPDWLQQCFNEVGPQSGLGSRLELSNSRIQHSICIIKMNSLYLSELPHSRDPNHLDQSLGISLGGV